MRDAITATINSYRRHRHADASSFPSCYTPVPYRISLIAMPSLAMRRRFSRRASASFRFAPLCADATRRQRRFMSISPPRQMRRISRHDVISPCDYALLLDRLHSHDFTHMPTVAEECYFNTHADSPSGHIFPE